VTENINDELKKKIEVAIFCPDSTLEDVELMLKHN
jgi:hypothetical protein